MNERRFLWTVTDPRGLSIACAQDVWEEHLTYRPELASHFDAVRLTVESPDEIHLDPVSTALRGPGIEIYWYYRSGLTTGRYAGNLVVAVVKIVQEPGHVRRGYLQSALVARRKARRLILIWPRSEL